MKHLRVGVKANRNHARGDAKPDHPLVQPVRRRQILRHAKARLQLAHSRVDVAVSQSTNQILLEPEPIRDAALGTTSPCLLYTSDAADEEDSVDLGGRRI